MQAGSISTGSARCTPLANRSACSSIQNSAQRRRCRAQASTSQATSRAEGLRDLDAKLRSVDPDDQSQQDAASRVVESMQAAGLVKGFGTTNQTPKRLYTLEELKWNRIDTTQLLSPEDTTLNGVQNQLQIALAAGVAALIAATGDFGYAGSLILLLVFLGGADTVANGGGVRALLVDTLGRKLNSSYSKRVAHHEAGHFLVAYLLGVLPVAYTLSSLDAFRRFGALNVQAGCRFADASFQREVATGGIKATSLGRFACIALAGVCSEYLKFGKAEGGLADLDGLDSMFKGLGFGQNKADGEVRWAVLNTVTVLRRHARTHDRLAAAMDRGASVGDCIALLEDDFASASEI